MEEIGDLKLRKDEGGLGFKDLLAFNVAMLGKQAWRISQQPNSLLSRLMKGLYYPNCDFWKAGNGSRPSWGWRSIVVGMDSISPNVMWSVGNGQQILVREDKWLRSGLIGGLATRDALEKVGELIEQGNGTWNETMIRRMLMNKGRRKSLLYLLDYPHQKINWYGCRINLGHIQ